MGNKHKKANKKKSKQSQKDILKPENLPLVSLCTPTFNRRPFIKQCIKNIMVQTYPLDKMEWVVIDDGTDKVGDLFNDVSGVKLKYLSYDEKMTLGKKRNLMHKESNGDIIIYIDDDDYYPPDRVMHAVTELLKSKKLIAGSSELHVWFENYPIHKFGPYGVNHATAGTFAFKRELLKDTSYQEDHCFAEEKLFLKSYTTPLIQLDPVKTILVFNHSHNTINKEDFITSSNKNVCKSDYDINRFIKCEDTLNFYTKELHELLKTYEEGLPKNKPDLIKALKEKNLLNDTNDGSSLKNVKKDTIITKDNNGNERKININELIQITNNLQNQNKGQMKVIEEYKKKIEELEKLVNEYKKSNEILMKENFGF